MKTKTILAIAISAAIATSCENKNSTSTATEKSPDPALGKFFTDVEISGTEPISSIRGKVSPGDEISLSGRVMGRREVFVDGRASFLIGDPTILTPCSEMGDDDHCPTPWDACCDTKENLRKGVASIQIVGEDGRVLKGIIQGTKGLKELSTVSVNGTVAPQSTPDSLIVNATSIHVREP